MIPGRVSRVFGMFRGTFARTSGASEPGAPRAPDGLCEGRFDHFGGVGAVRPHVFHVPGAFRNARNISPTHIENLLYTILNPHILGDLGGLGPGRAPIRVSEFFWGRILRTRLGG